MQAGQTKNFIILAVVLTINLFLLYIVPPQSEPTVWLEGVPEDFSKTLQKIVIQGSDNSVSLFKDGEGWFIDQEPALKASPERIRNLVDIFQNLECSAEALKGEPHEYGLHNPQRILTFTGSENLVIKVGDSTPSQLSDYLYCLDAIRRTRIGLRGRIPVTVNYYRESLLQSFPIQSIESILFEDGSEIRKIDNLWKQVHPHTADLDTSAMERWLSTLSQIHLEEFDHTPNVELTHSLTLRSSQKDFTYIWSDGGDIQSVDQKSGKVSTTSLMIIKKQPAEFYAQSLYTHHLEPVSISFHHKDTELVHFEAKDLAFQTFFSRIENAKIQRRLMPKKTSEYTLKIVFQDGNIFQLSIVEEEDQLQLYSNLEDVIMIMPIDVIEGFYARDMSSK